MERHTQTKRIRLMLGLIMLTVITSVHAQQKNQGFWGTIEYSYGFGLADNGDLYDFKRPDWKMETHTLRLVMGYFATPYVSVGAGVGLAGHHSPSINTLPVFADFRYFFNGTQRSFFAYTDLGASIALDNHYKTGMLVDLGFGRSFPIGRRSAFIPSIGYNLAGYKTEFKYIENNLTFTETDNRTRHTLFVRIGLSF